MSIITRSLYISFVFLLLSQVTFGAVFTQNLALGSNSIEVKKVQQFLIDKGYLKASATGYFGAQTKKAVQDFQRSFSVHPSGIWNQVTRQKAELLITEKEKQLATSTRMITENAPSGSKNVTLTLSLTQGGTVFSSDKLISCYTFEECKKVLPNGKKITLQAYPSEGYILKNWSEASCGTNPICEFIIHEDMKVHVYFIPAPKMKYEGKIVYPKDNDTCYIPFGENKCIMKFYWVNNTGLDMSVKISGQEYILVVKEPDLTKVHDIPNPQDIAIAEREKAYGPAYFPLYVNNVYTVQLLSHNQVLDTKKVTVKCEEGSVWDGQYCNEKNATVISMTNKAGGVITSIPPRLSCGYFNGQCNAGFSNGSKVTLIANPVPGYTFHHWSGVCENSTEPICTFTASPGLKVVEAFMYGTRKMTEYTYGTKISSSSKPVPGCVTDWTCANWKTCQNMKSTRVCYDLNNCNNFSNPPTVSFDCK